MQRHDVEKREKGRPTQYRPEMCEIVIQKGKEGASIAEMAMACGVARGNLYRYEEAFPEFKEAFRLAKDYAIATLERIGRENLTNRNFREFTYQFKLSNKYGTGFDSGFRLPYKYEKLSITEKLDVLWRRFCRGVISVNDLKDAYAALNSRATIKQKSELEPLLKEIQEKLPDFAK